MDRGCFKFVGIDTSHWDLKHHPKAIPLGEDASRKKLHSGLH
jgi:hypothetical protein